MMDKGQPEKVQDYQDYQVDSQNCCGAFIRSSWSSHSFSNTKKSQHSLKSSKQAGIKLTYKPKRIDTLPTPQLIKRASDPLKLTRELSGKQQENDKQRVGSYLNLMTASRKAIMAQKCIDYKNKKIQQHNKNQVQVEHSSTQRLHASSKQQLLSTRKNTAQTLKYSEDCSHAQKETHNLFSNIRIEQSLKLSRFDHERRLVISSKQKDSNKKTLERVFQETQGKRIVTLQSQFSNEDQSNEYSIAQHFDFPKKTL